MEVERINELLKFENLHVLVLGDIMLDEYLIGDSNRISPEAPVPVVNLKNKVHRLGGAANVALNTNSLGARTSLIGIIGDDEAGEIITRITNETDGVYSYLIKDHSRRSTCKTRVLAANQQLLRIDNEDTFDASLDIVAKVQNMLKYIHHNNALDIIILQDYNKGVFSPEMIEMVISWSKENGVKTALDPKERNIDLYKGVDVFKPNLREIVRYLGSEVILDLENLKLAGSSSIARMACNLLVLTLSAKGIFLMDQSEAHWERTSIQNIVDVSGAGDTVISIVSLLYAAGEASMEEIGKLANYSGSAVCKVPGVGVIDKSMILNITKSME
jgi:rfaE bifunctional protein kinase chain/domain